MSWSIIAMGDHTEQVAEASGRRAAFAKAEEFRRGPKGCDFVTVHHLSKLVAAWGKPKKKWKFLRVSEL
jgi:hypothetical protein